MTPFDDHFQRPRHAGVLDPADGRVEVENPICGDVLALTWRWRDGRLAGVRFQVYGCPAAIAAGSALTELIGGADAAALAALRPEAVSNALGGLDADREHAAVLAIDAVQALLRQSKNLPPDR
jgi:nitrogen fixation NifU-like protein